jgi:hypothetical protein
MAQRKFEQFQLSLEKEVVTLYGNIPIGATGAVGTLTKNQNQGINSVVRNSTGNYTITFGNSAQNTIDKYVRAVSVDVQVLFGTVSAVAGYQIFADNSASGNIIIQFTGPTSSSVTTPVAVDPDNGAVLLLAVSLKNSSV